MPVIRCRKLSCKRVICAWSDGSPMPTEKDKIKCPHCGTVTVIRKKPKAEKKHGGKDGSSGTGSRNNQNTKRDSECKQLQTGGSVKEVSDKVPGSE